MNSSESFTYVRIEREIDDPWEEFVERSKNLISFWKKSLIFEIVGGIGAVLFLSRLLGLIKRENKSSDVSPITAALITLFLSIAIVFIVASFVILVLGIVKVIMTFLCINRALDWSPDIKARCILSECRAALIGIASSTIICSLAGCAITRYLIPLALKFCYYKICKEIIPY